MRRLLIGTALAVLALTGCSKKDNGGRSPSGGPAYEVSEAPSATTADRAPPAINPSAAPGVAFTYHYDFQLPDDSISKVQEAHAARCEALGLAKCRITGLKYHLGEDDAVSAELDLKLAPDVARGFGKEATADVIKSSGRLSDTEFTGEDTAPASANAVATTADVERRTAELRARVAAAGVKDVERAQLQAELDNLHEQGADAKATLGATRVQLAATPMTFAYYGKGGITGFNGHNPLTDAGRSFVASLVTMISFVLGLLATLLPWLALLALVLFLARTRAARAVWRGLRPVRSGDEDQEPV